MPLELAAARQLTGAWTGRVIAVAGVSRGRIVAAAYNPATRHWSIISPTLSAHHPASEMAMVAIPGRLLIWSLWSRTTTTSNNDLTRVTSGIDVLALGPAGHWTNVTAHWPQHEVVANPAYANGTILIPPGGVWCGACYPPPYVYPARLANAATLALTTVPPGPLVTHTNPEPSFWLWNGRAALAADITDNSDSPFPHPLISKLAAFDPPSRSWHILPAPPGHPPIAANSIWAGQELLLLTLNGLLSFHA